MTIEQLKAAFYNIRGVDFVEFNVDKRVLSVSVGVDGGRIEAVCLNQDQLDELIDIVEVHQAKAICDKKREVKVKFVSDRS